MSLVSKRNESAFVKLSCQQGETILPVMPSQFEVQVVQNNSTININAFGELNMKGKTGLRTISIESFFPAQQYDFLQTASIETPYNYVSKLDKWRKEGEVITLLITDTDINFNCLIESFNYSEKDGSNDVYYSLTLKEYKDISALDKSEKDITTGLNNRMTPKTAFANDGFKILSTDSALGAVQKTVRNVTNSISAPVNNALDIYKNVVKTTKDNINIAGKIIKSTRDGAVSILDSVSEVRGIFK